MCLQFAFRGFLKITTHNKCNKCYIFNPFVVLFGQRQDENNISLQKRWRLCKYRFALKIELNLMFMCQKYWLKLGGSMCEGVWSKRKYWICAWFLRNGSEMSMTKTQQINTTFVTIVPCNVQYKLWLFRWFKYRKHGRRRQHYHKWSSKIYWIYEKNLTLLHTLSFMESITPNLIDSKARKYYVNKRLFDASHTAYSQPKMLLLVAWFKPLWTINTYIALYKCKWIHCWFY